MSFYFAIGLFGLILVGCKNENWESAERRISALEKDQKENQTKIKKIQDQLNALAVHQEQHRHKYIIRNYYGNYGLYLEQSTFSEPPAPQAEVDENFRKIKENEENDWLNKIFK